jgi:hypothetical protein
MEAPGASLPAGIFIGEEIRPDFQTKVEKWVEINPIENMIWEENDPVPSWSHVEYVKWNGQGFIGLLIMSLRRASPAVS